MTLVSPPSSPTIELRRCEALLVDEEMFCNVPIRSPRGRFCNSHGREYVQLTQAYKSVSKAVEELKSKAWLSRKQLRALCSIIEVDIAIRLAEEWRKAILEEIRGRQVQHRRFFVTWDKGHQQWLDHLALTETKAEDLIARLHTRRLEIANADEARRQIDAYEYLAWSRAMGAARQAAYMEELRRPEEAASQLRVDAYTARPSSVAVGTPAPLRRTTGAGHIGHAQRPPGYAAQPSPVADRHSPHVDLESQMPVIVHADPWSGDRDTKSVCFTVFLLLLLMLLWGLPDTF